MIDAERIRARRAAGEPFSKIAEDFGICELTARRKVWGERNKPQPVDTERSYVVHKTIIGKCSTDYHTTGISLARSAATYEVPA